MASPRTVARRTSAPRPSAAGPRSARGKCRTRRRRSRNWRVAAARPPRPGRECFDPAPSEPSRGQLAPPSASTVAWASTARGPSGVSNDSRPLSSQPVQRGATRIARPASPAAAARRAAAARLSSPCGNTRPLEPTKVGWPSASLHARNAPAGMRRSPAQAAAWPRRSGRESRQRLAVGQIEPAAPGHQQLAARRRHRVIDRHAGAALRQHLGRHQAGGTGTDDGDCCLMEDMTPSLARSRQTRRHGLVVSDSGLAFRVRCFAPRNDGVTTSPPPSPRPGRHISGSARMRRPAPSPSTCR